MNGVRTEEQYVMLVARTWRCDNLIQKLETLNGGVFLCTMV